MTTTTSLCQCVTPVRLTGEWTPGVGLASMRERASEVGGSLDITTNGDGSLVRASLPFS